jgi:hypothetical protein
MASSIIGLQSVTWKKYVSRTINDVGKYVSVYDAGTTIKASVQPVSRSVYEQNGLDLQKNYINIYTAEPMVDLKRDHSSDRILYNGGTYQLPSNQGDWFAVDGWNAYLAVQIG